MILSHYACNPLIIKDESGYLQREAHIKKAPFEKVLEVNT